MLNKYIKLITILTLSFSIAIHLTYIWTPKSAFDGDWRFNVKRMMDGEAYKPFAYRTLVPSTVKIIIRQISEENIKYIQLIKPEILNITRILSFEDQKIYFAFYVIIFISYFSVVGFLIFVYLLHQRLYKSYWLSSIGAMIFTGYLLPLFIYREFLYDMTTLFFFTGLLYLLSIKNWGWFYLLLTLGSFNKETTFLIIPVFMLYCWGKQDRIKFFTHLTTQILLTSVIKYYLYQKYKQNPGSLIEMHFIDNLQILWHAHFLFNFQSLSSIILTVVCLLAFFKTKPKFLRCSLIVPVILLLLWIYAGVWEEIRVFYESLPILGLLGYDTISKIISLNYHKNLINSPTQKVKNLFDDRRMEILANIIVASISVCVSIIIIITWYQKISFTRPGFLGVESIHHYLQPKEAGTRWDHPNNLNIPVHGVIIELGSTVHNQDLEISLDHNDTYVLDLLLHDKKIATLDVPLTNEPPGLTIHNLKIPSEALGTGFNRIRIEPRNGDGKYALGHIFLSN